MHLEEVFVGLHSEHFLFKLIDIDWMPFLHIDLFVLSLVQSNMELPVVYTRPLSWNWLGSNPAYFIHRLSTFFDVVWKIDTALQVIWWAVFLKGYFGKILGVLLRSCKHPVILAKTCLHNLNLGIEIFVLLMSFGQLLTYFRSTSFNFAYFAFSLSIIFS